MKKLSLICLLSLSLLSVRCDFLKIDDPKPELPPIIMTGENTFGAIVNGKISLNNDVIGLRAVNQNSSILDIGASFIDRSRGIDQSIFFVIRDDNLSVGQYELMVYQDLSRVASFRNFESECYYDYRLNENTRYTGTLNILKLDDVNRIVSGTFEFTISVDGCPDVQVEQGRFDLKLIN
jgi:hypothetical protein